VRAATELALQLTPRPSRATARSRLRPRLRAVRSLRRSLLAAAAHPARDPQPRSRRQRARERLGVVHSRLGHLDSSKSWRGAALCPRPARSTRSLYVGKRRRRRRGSRWLRSRRPATAGDLAARTARARFDTGRTGHPGPPQCHAPRSAASHPGAVPIPTPSGNRSPKSAVSQRIGGCRRAAPAWPSFRNDFAFRRDGLIPGGYACSPSVRPRNRVCDSTSGASVTVHWSKNVQQSARWQKSRRARRQLANHCPNRRSASARHCRRRRGRPTGQRPRVNPAELRARALS